MNGLDPRICAFARVEFWRRGPVIGISSVETVDRADLAIISVPIAGVAGAAHALCFELPRQRADFDTTLAALKAVYALGRRDVIRQVRDIFEEPRANG